MGFDTGYGGGDQQGDGGSFFDDPSFLAQLQGAFGGGYDQAPPETAYGAIGGAPGGPVNLGAGGGALFSPHPTPMPAGGGQGNPVSLPDGSQAPSPFEVGGNSGSASGPPMGSAAWLRARDPHYGDLSWGESQMGKRAQQWNQNPGGGWYGGYGQQGGGGQQQWYRPQGPQGSSRPDPSNPGAAYDAGPGRWEAQQQAQRDQMNTQAQGPRQPQGGPQRWGMPQGGAYGRPMPMRKRRFYGNGGGPMPPGSPGAASNLGGPAYQTQGPAPTGGGYNI